MDLCGIKFVGLTPENSGKLLLSRALIGHYQINTTNAKDLKAA